MTIVTENQLFYDDLWLHIAPWIYTITHGAEEFRILKPICVRCRLIPPTEQGTYNKSLFHSFYKKPLALQWNKQMVPAAMWRRKPRSSGPITKSIETRWAERTNHCIYHASPSLVNWTKLPYFLGSPDEDCNCDKILQMIDMVNRVCKLW